METCLGGQVVDYALVWELIQSTRFTGEERHMRWLRKIAALEHNAQHQGKRSIDGPVTGLQNSEMALRL